MKNNFIRIKGLPDGTTVKLQYIKIKGKAKKPKVAIIATQHGDEFFSILILDHFLKQLKKIKGELIVFPIANPIAFNEVKRINPIDGKDMNRIWPGKATGSLTQRFCHEIWEKIKDCDYVLDLHNGNKNILDTPQARIYKKYLPRVLELNDYLDLPFLMVRKKPLGKTLIGTCHEHGITAISIEIGEGRRITPEYIDEGVRVLNSFLRYTGMLPGRKRIKTTIIHDHDKQTIKATSSGLFIPNYKALGKKTKNLGTLLTFPHFTKKPVTVKKPGHFLSLYVGGVVNEGAILARVTKG